MELHELIHMTTLINRLAKRALFAEEQMVALEGQCAEWKRIADELKAERNAAKQEAVSARQDAVTRAEADRKRIDGLMIQAQDMRIERLKKPRQHPVKVGESVRRTTEGSIAPIGTLGRVLVVWSDAYQVALRKGFSTMWAFDDCTPCDPPPEASHITPEGKRTAEGAVEPKPGDVVRLVREPTHTDIPAMLPWSSAFGMPGDTATVVIMAVPDKLPNGTIPVRTSKGQAFFWFLS